MFAAVSESGEATQTIIPLPFALYAAIYDVLLPGWREAPLVAGNRRLRCPLREHAEPSLEIRTETLGWSCRAGCGDGVAIDLAVRMLGQKDARKLLLRLEGSPAPHPSGVQAPPTPLERILGEVAPNLQLRRLAHAIRALPEWERYRRERARARRLFYDGEDTGRAQELANAAADRLLEPVVILLRRRFFSRRREIPEATRRVLADVAESLRVRFRAMTWRPIESDDGLAAHTPAAFAREAFRVLAAPGRTERQAPARRSLYGAGLTILGDAARQLTPKRE